MHIITTGLNIIITGFFINHLSVSCLFIFFIHKNYPQKNQFTSTQLYELITSVNILYHLLFLSSKTE